MSHGLIVMALLLSAQLGIAAEAQTQATADTTRDFLWEQANMQAASATTQADYTKALDTYQRLIREGTIQGKLFINQGNTAILSNDPQSALRAFARAERYLGLTPEIKQGMLAALSRQANHEQNELPWSHAAFFWHYAFPCETRAYAFFVGWSILWLGLLLLFTFRKTKKATALLSFADTCILAGGFLSFIFLASVIVTLLQEAA